MCSMYVCTVHTKIENYINDSFHIKIFYINIKKMNEVFLSPFLAFSLHFVKSSPRTQKNKYIITIIIKA